MCKNIIGRNIYVRSKFSYVHSSHDLCAHLMTCACAHSPTRTHLRENIDEKYFTNVYIQQSKIELSF